MLITLFTDAGFCPKNNVASYAVWAKSDGKTVRKSGQLRGILEGADIAEMRALANGVAVVIASFDPPPASRIIAQTDCQGAINAMLGTGYKKKAAQDRVKHAVEAMTLQLKKRSIVIEYRHVKGHSGSKTPRNAVNTWCDKECKRHLSEARLKINNAEAAA